MVSQLEAKLRDNRKQATEWALYFAGLFLIFINRLEKSKEYVDRMVKLAPNFKEGLILKGWLELKISGEDTDMSSIHSFFDAPSTRFKYN